MEVYVIKTSLVFSDSGGNLKNNDNTYPPLWNVSANIIALTGLAMGGVDVV